MIGYIYKEVSQKYDEDDLIIKFGGFIHGGLFAGSG